MILCGAVAVVAEARSAHTAEWTGTDMIVFGGAASNSSVRANDVAQYFPYDTDTIFCDGFE